MDEEGPTYAIIPAKHPNSSIRGRLEAILGHLGAILGRLGAILGPSWDDLGQSWDHLGHLKLSWRHRGAMLSHLAAKTASREPHVAKTLFLQLISAVL